MLSVCIPELVGNFLGTALFVSEKKTHLCRSNRRKSTRSQIFGANWMLDDPRTGNVYIYRYWVLPSLKFRSPIEYFFRVTVFVRFGENPQF